jgi:Zn-dependent protease/CBS domain-containing protein
MGFEVKIDSSWIFIALLVSWSLSTGLFPFQYKGLSTVAYWLMGITGAAGLFISIILHEFAHSVVARKNGIPMKGITLFIFGGVAEMGDEPPGAGAEFRMAIVGPLTSAVLSGIFYLIYNSFGDKSRPVTGIIGYLAMINGILAIFNMLPAFPLDGGRVLRSILWRLKNNLDWATKISSKIGSGFGILLIIFGVINVVRGNFIGGVWWFLIGFFLNNAAKLSYQKLVTRRVLEGEPVSRFMNDNPIYVVPDLSVEKLVTEYVYRHHHKMYPVVEDDAVRGYVDTSMIKSIDREDWAGTEVGEIMKEPSEENCVSPDKDAIDALSLMNQNGLSRLMVVENGNLKGIISLKDMLNFLSLKIEMER